MFEEIDESRERGSFTIDNNIKKLLGLLDIVGETVDKQFLVLAHLDFVNHGAGDVHDVLQPVRLLPNDEPNTVVRDRGIINQVQRV